MIIGITGGIASGKSEVCRFLESQGFIHIDADEIAHDVLELPEVIGTLTSYFGNEILSASDEIHGPLFIDRKKLGKIVFADAEKMKLLENITHPHIIKKIECMINENRECDFVIEAIKIVSSGLVHLCDELWVVHADYEQQLNRLMKFRRMTYEEAITKLASQKNHDWDEASADHVIYSTEPIETMYVQVLNALNKEK